MSFSISTARIIGTRDIHASHEKSAAGKDKTYNNDVRK
jgi:hypothetical protein